MIALLVAAFASEDPPEQLELDVRTAMRSRSVGVPAGAATFGGRSGMTTEVRVRLLDGDRPVGMQLTGAWDWGAGFLAEDRRPERWGSVRGVLTTGGRTPRATTRAYFTGGVASIDLPVLSQQGHQPGTVAVVGAELHNFVGDRAQDFELDLHWSPITFGGSLRVGGGVLLGPGGWGLDVAMGAGLLRVHGDRTSQLTSQLEFAFFRRHRARH